MHLTAIAILLSGCKQDSPGPPACTEDEPIIGDPEGEPEIEVVEIGADGTMRPIVDGDPVVTFSPPQGGGIVLVGARIHNMTACHVQVAGRLRDPTREGEPVGARDGRTVEYVEMTERPGWAEPVIHDPTDLGSVIAAGPNINSCAPNEGGRDMYGCEWILQVTAEDFAGRLAERHLTVLPDCPVEDPGTVPKNVGPADEQASCRCECAANFAARGDCDDLEPYRDRAPVCTAP